MRGLSSESAGAPGAPELSAIVITRNEEARIGACLASLSFAGEIIVVDNASSDRTPEIAQDAGARVHHAPDWPGFGPQKNRALALATGDWVFSLDADETITPSLRESILAAVRVPGAHQAFAVDRTSSYCGQVIRHAGWSPDWIVRLFRRDAARFSDDLVHERVLVQGSVGRLQGELMHRSFPDFESVLDKVNRYSTAGARSLAGRGKRASPAKAVGHGLWAFLRTYVLQRGFLDGAMGLALAISNAEGTYYRYLKLWLLQRERATGTPHP